MLNRAFALAHRAGDSILCATTQQPQRRLPKKNNKKGTPMLAALLLIVLFYAILACLPADHLPLFRRIAAVPVAVLMFIGFALLATCVDGQAGLRQLWGEVSEVRKDFRGFLRDLFTLR